MRFWLAMNRKKSRHMKSQYRTGPLCRRNFTALSKHLTVPVPMVQVRIMRM